MPIGLSPMVWRMPKPISCLSRASTKDCRSLAVLHKFYSLYVPFVCLALWRVTVQADPPDTRLFSVADHAYLVPFQVVVVTFFSDMMCMRLCVLFTLERPVKLVPGPLIIDEAVDLAKTIANGNPRSALLALLPITTSSVTHATIVKQRRILEDKLMLLLVCL